MADDNVIIVPKVRETPSYMNITKSNQSIGLKELEEIKKQIEKTFIKIRVYKLSAYKDVVLNLAGDLENIETDIEHEAVKRITEDQADWNPVEGYTCDILKVE